jgi:hypothetical protein
MTDFVALTELSAKSYGERAGVSMCQCKGARTQPTPHCWSAATGVILLAAKLHGRDRENHCGNGDAPELRYG